MVSKKPSDKLKNSIENNTGRNSPEPSMDRPSRLRERPQTSTSTNSDTSSESTEDRPSCSRRRFDEEANESASSSSGSRNEQRRQAMANPTPKIVRRGPKHPAPQNNTDRKLTEPPTDRRSRLGPRNQTSASPTSGASSELTESDRPSCSRRISDEEAKENASCSSGSSNGKKRQAVAHSAQNKNKKAPKEPIPQVTCCKNMVDLEYGSSNRYCKNGCTILVGEFYRENPTKTVYCIECFEEKLRTESRIKPECWSKIKNFNESKENILVCTKCKKKFHECCSLDVHGGRNFTCATCSQAEKRKTLKDYRRNNFERNMECNINEFLRKKTRTPNGQALKNPLSVVSFRHGDSAKTKKQVPTFYRSEFVGKYGREIDYETRFIYIFQQIGDVDVLVFIMNCQEYKNLLGQNWAVIDYMDTVAYVEPEDLRGRVFGEVILCYFSYVKSIGYNIAHFFSNPPAHRDDDYFFNIHPRFHEYLSEERLLKWYNCVLKKGKEDKIISKIRTFKEYRKLKPCKKPSDLAPLIDGLWIRCLKEIDDSIDTKSVGDEQYEQEFHAKLRAKFKCNAENNFFLELSKNKSTVNDPDSFNKHAILSDRDNLMELWRKKNWEFSTLRRAKHASVGLIAIIFGEL